METQLTAKEREMQAAKEFDMAISDIEKKYSVKLLTQVVFTENDSTPRFIRVMCAI